MVYGIKVRNYGRPTDKSMSKTTVTSFLRKQKSRVSWNEEMLIPDSGSCPE